MNHSDTLTVGSRVRHTDRKDLTGTVVLVSDDPWGNRYLHVALDKYERLGLHPTRYSACMLEAE